MKKYMVVLSYYKFEDDLELKYKFFDTLEECINSVKKFIKKYNLTETQWTGGQVYSNNQLVCRLGHNIGLDANSYK